MTEKEHALLHLLSVADQWRNEYVMRVPEMEEDEGANERDQKLIEAVDQWTRAVIFGKA